MLYVVLAVSTSGWLPPLCSKWFSSAPVWLRGGDTVYGVCICFGDLLRGRSAEAEDTEGVLARSVAYVVSTIGLLVEGADVLL